MTRIPAFFISLALAILIPAPAAHATFFGSSGRIAFSRLVGEMDPDIYNTDIFLTQVDGSQQRPITDSGFGENSPSFSPDGREMVFYRDSNGLALRRAVSGGPERVLARQRVTETHFWKPFDMNWSPDGTKLVMQWQAYDRLEGAWGPSAIVVLSADGTGRETIVPPHPDYSYSSPRWSPDGKEITFQRSGREVAGGGRVLWGSSDIMSVSAKGGEPRELTPDTLSDRAPSWTPDGRIMYVARTCMGLPYLRCTEIRTMARDGSDIQTVLFNPDFGEDGYPDFIWEAATAPDGGKIVLSTIPTMQVPFTYTPWELWVYDPGRGKASLVAEDHEGDADWQPICTETGTRGDDVLYGTPDRDLICGLGGNDAIYGLGGDDVIFGHGGDDEIAGNGGRDIVVGNGGRDRCDRDERDHSRVC